MMGILFLDCIMVGVRFYLGYCCIEYKGMEFCGYEFYYFNVVVFDVMFFVVK